MMSFLSSNKPPECWLKLGALIRQDAHGCRSYEIIDGYKQSFVSVHISIVN